VLGAAGRVGLPTTSEEGLNPSVGLPSSAARPSVFQESRLRLEWALGPEGNSSG